MKRTLITGTNGFLASRLIDYVGKDVFGISRGRNHKTAIEKCPVFYCDILDLETLKRVISDNEINTIFHVAAQSIVRIANANPRYAFEDNILGTVNILEAVRQLDKNIRVVCASSDKCYGDHDELPYREDFALKAGDPYSTSKAAADLVAQSYHKTYGLKVSIVRSANIYGAGDMNLSRIIPSTITKILEGKKPIIYSDVLNFKREFIYVDDVCEAYMKIAENGIPGEAYNVGTGEVYKVGEIVEKICRIMNWEEGVDIVEKKFNEIKVQYLSSEKIFMNLSWYPKVKIDDGLKMAVDWYKQKFLK